MTKYNIDVASARGAASGARGEFDDLYGHEGLIEEAGEGLADAVEESKINDALKENFSGFLKPWTATLINHGKNLLNAADTIISTFVEADGDMEDSANKTRRDNITKATERIDDTPAYDPNVPSSSSSSTSAENSHGGNNSNNSEDGGHDW